MKALLRPFTPTKNRRFNELIGFCLIAAALLLVLALASYSPSDPSLNTAAAISASSSTHNWIGPVGAIISDLALQLFGIAVFSIPVMLGLLGLRWFRSRPMLSPFEKLLGAAILLLFVPALMALVPGHLRWMHTIAIEGLSGKILGDFLIHYFNLLGAYLVALCVIAAALYLSTTFSFTDLHLWMETRFAFLGAAWQRFHDWRAERAKAKAMKELEERKANRPMITSQLVPASKPATVVTTYEMKPEAGVKYSRITGLSDDLCLAMRAESILIERMAGKSTVGIQVPNAERETIYLREVVESQGFLDARSRLTLALGKDINGRIMTADLVTMPHLLIAGSTGAGKSVAINAMIMSLLFKATPEQVRLILVDHKRVELGNYDGVPHLYTPIITEPKLAAVALRNAVREMERRLKLLAEKDVRNIDQYNKLFEDEGTRSMFGEDSEDRPLPFIVIIIDELADLMMLDSGNVEESVTRLAQMARAVGIHLVLATQRPSVDVITGLIKANFPARMSFRVATKVDSRTILDANGAEALLGRGDMLYLPSGSARVHRLHAPFVTEKEIAAVVEFWRSQGTAEYEQKFLDVPKEEREAAAGGEGGMDGDENDALFEDAVRLVLEFGKA